MPTYGYQRVHALLRRNVRKDGRLWPKAKHVCRVMKLHNLLLVRHTGTVDDRLHDGQVTVERSNIRWCSDGFEIGCDNKEKVRVCPASERWGRLHFLQRLVTVGNSKKPAIWRRGSASCRDNTRPAESRSFSASASGETAMFANFSCTAYDHAFGISTEHGIDWGTGWIVSKPECTQTKLLSHLLPK